MHWIAPTEKDTAAEQAAPAPHFTKAEYNGARLEGLVLGLSFLKYISGTFEEHRVKVRMIEDRNLTSHAYDEALANRIYRHIAHDYAPLLGSMARKIQTLEWD